MVFISLKKIYNIHNLNMAFSQKQLQIDYITNT